MQTKTLARGEWVAPRKNTERARPKKTTGTPTKKTIERLTKGGTDRMPTRTGGRRSNPRLPTPRWRPRGRPENRSAKPTENWSRGHTRAQSNYTMTSAGGGAQGENHPRGINQRSEGRITDRITDQKPTDGSNETRADWLVDLRQGFPGADRGRRWWTTPPALGGSHGCSIEKPTLEEPTGEPSKQQAKNPTLGPAEKWVNQPTKQIGKKRKDSARSHLQKTERAGEGSRQPSLPEKNRARPPKEKKTVERDRNPDQRRWGRRPTEKEDRTQKSGRDPSGTQHTVVANSEQQSIRPNPHSEAQAGAKTNEGGKEKKNIPGCT